MSILNSATAATALFYISRELGRFPNRRTRRNRLDPIQRRVANIIEPQPVIEGFQLWVNLPASLKMTRPRYQGISASEIPAVEIEGGTKIRVITGTVDGVSGPVSGIAADPIYLDVSVPAHSSFSHQIARGHTAFAYVF